MSSPQKAWDGRTGFWVLCGVGLGLLLLLGRGWALRAEADDLQGQIRRVRADVEEVQPIIQRVEELRARQKRLQSLVVDLVERPRIHQATDAVLTALAGDVLLERLEVRGLDVRVLALADDERAAQRFVDALRQGGGFHRVGRADDAPGEAPVPPRFAVRGELDVPWPGDEE